MIEGDGKRGFRLQKQYSRNAGFLAEGHWFWGGSVGTGTQPCITSSIPTGHDTLHACLPDPLSLLILTQPTALDPGFGL